MKLLVVNPLLYQLSYPAPYCSPRLQKHPADTAQELRPGRSDATKHVILHGTARSAKYAVTLKAQQEQKPRERGPHKNATPEKQRPAEAGLCITLSQRKGGNGGKPWFPSVPDRSPRQRGCRGYGGKPDRGAVPDAEPCLPPATASVRDQARSFCALPRSHPASGSLLLVTARGFPLLVLRARRQGGTVGW
jgi:hypothetical protein